MASNINPSLTPVNSLTNFKFWCQKVLPLVYDDSLSYYEVLGKMVVQLNDVIDNVNDDTENVLTLKDAFLELQTYVNNFFDDIDQLASYAERAEAAQTAANTSAVNAATSASNASASSLAAMDARDTAVTAKQAAETSANTASTAATNANTKANEAAQSAITAQTAQASASQSATLAATDRSAAQTAASTATTKANEASTSASNAETSAENASQSEANAEELVNNIQEKLDNIQHNTQDISDLKESISDTQDWLGYPKNVFDARTFTVSNTNNWSIDSATKTSITIRHNNTYSTGYPIAVLNLPAGKYDFHADYTDSNTPFSLRANGSWVKSLNDGAEIDIDEENTYEIYFSNSVAGTYTIANIGIIPQETTGKIPTIEADISVLQTSESATAQTVEDLQTGFNSIAQPEISELVGEETLNKVINASGTLITGGSDYYRVNKYNVIVGKKYWVTACANWENVPWCIYDSNDTPILTGTPSEKQSDFTIINNEEITAPAKSAYIIIAYQATTIQGVLKTQTGYKIAKWLGKKWVCVGDSLTAKNIRTTKHYFDYVAEETGITPINMGVSGSGYARMADSNQAFYQRISSCPTDADVVTIFGSWNDLGAGLEIGTVTDTGTTTLAGCINTTIDNLQAVIPLVNLGIVAPTPWDTTQPSTSGNDYNYVEMLKTICEHRSIPFLDLWRCSNLRPWDADFRELAYSKDEGSGTHPDENGHKLIAPRFKAFLETLLM